MTRIVYIGAPEGFEALRAVAGDRAECVHAASEPAALAAALVDADALLDAAIRVPLTDAMVEAAPRLAIVSCASTGADHVARAALTARGAPVRTLREDGDLLRSITPAAELSFALLLACARRLPQALAHVRDGGWNRELFPGLMLNGRTLGIVGCGRIGQWMARYGTAFGMRILGHDPHVHPWPDGIEQVPLARLVAEADAITVHVHLSDETRGLLGPDLLRAVKPGVIVVNTSRGGIVDEAALLEGLEAGRIGAAGLDVLAGEPEVADHPLLAYARRHDNLLVTPHCGGFSPDAVRRVCTRAAEKIVQHLGLDR
jgi:phosphoglycerate dehydrogenase-like enzyme